jgi:DNA-binding transcriptional regulator GbsR (MarR family)
MGKNNKLEEAKEVFISQWGTLGSGWGVNRTFAQIQGLLMVSDSPLCTDEIMERLSISRGNAHANLKMMINWGLAKVEIRPGDRKEYFVGEKEPWKLFVAVAKERQRREIDPSLAILNDCIDNTQGIDSKEADDFRKQIQNNIEFMERGTAILEKLIKHKNSKILSLIMKILG